MGKKVKIPIKDATEDAEGKEEEIVEENSAEEQAAADEVEGEAEGLFGELFSDEDDEKPKEAITGLDSSFTDRDVDFTGLDDSDTGGSASNSAEVERLEAEVKDLQQKYLRALADLENFRKRAQKEKSDLLKYQGEKILVDIVDVLDNLELALQHKDAEIENLRTGIEMIHQQFRDALDRWGIRADSGLGAQFDPNRQNAINKVPSPDAEPGSVIAELKKAYFYKDKLLRVGEVVVAVAAEDAENTDESSAQE